MSCLPDRMRAVEIAAPGGPEVLRLAERPLPQPQAGEVLIRVRAAGVNRPDCLQREGRYAPPPGASDIPGLEVAGEVAALGQGVPDWAVGDKVCALLAGGGYAEYAAVPAGQCLPIPEGLSWDEAAGIPETWFTVWSNLVDRAKLKAGERVLIHGGASGIGTAGIQLARLLRAEVFATAGSTEKTGLCEALGARSINYKTEDFVEQIQAWTQGRGVDVVLDMVGADYLARNLDCLAPDGRLVSIATLTGRKAEIDLGLVMQKRLWLTGSTLRARDMAFKAAIAQSLRQTVWPALAQGLVRVVIDSRFPLAQAAQAHARIEGDHAGKIILTV